MDFTRNGALNLPFDDMSMVNLDLSTGNPHQITNNVQHNRDTVRYDHVI